MVFRLDFPPVILNKQSFKNSSPEFSTPPADYVCLNKPYRVSFKATDADGDKLTYELIDPLAGYTSEFPVENRIGSGQSMSVYPPVNWNAGFNAQRAIPGNPSLQINPTTGELTVTATSQGLYAFAVVVHEVRNGQEIGQVRREFQLPVVDCKQNQVQPTPPIIMLNGRYVLSQQNCEGALLTLSITPEAGYTYQWQRNGIELDGETKVTLSVSEEGRYRVLKKFIQNCGRDTTSEAVLIYCHPQLYLPTAFTPNGDGVNDVWTIFQATPIAEMEVTIYDRWGTVVFHSIGYSQPWDGTFQSQKLPPGVYTYLIQMPNQPPQKGSIQLVI